MKHLRKVHWMFRGRTGTFAWCCARRFAAMTEDPTAVTCQSCRRALLRARQVEGKEGGR